MTFDDCSDLDGCTGCVNCAAITRTHSGSHRLRHMLQPNSIGLGRVAYRESCSLLNSSRKEVNLLANHSGGNATQSPEHNNQAPSHHLGVCTHFYRPVDYLFKFFCGQHAIIIQINDIKYNVRILLWDREGYHNQHKLVEADSAVIVVIEDSQKVLGS